MCQLRRLLCQQQNASVATPVQHCQQPNAADQQLPPTSTDLPTEQQQQQSSATTTSTTTTTITTTTVTSALALPSPIPTPLPACQSARSDVDVMRNQITELEEQLVLYKQMVHRHKARPQSSLLEIVSGQGELSIEAAVRLIQGAGLRLTPKRPDSDKFKACTSCKTRFTFLWTTRPLHCDMCGAVVCDKCLVGEKQDDHDYLNCKACTEFKAVFLAFAEKLRA